MVYLYILSYAIIISSYWSQGFIWISILLSVACELVMHLYLNYSPETPILSSYLQH